MVAKLFGFAEPLSVAPVSVMLPAARVVTAGGNKGAVTVKDEKGALVPEGVVTVNVRAPVAAPAVMVMSADTLPAALAVIAAVTPVPEKVTAVAPVRLLPVMVADTVVPRVPLAGVMAVIEGAIALNVAVIAESAVMEKTQLAVPVHPAAEPVPPDQPAKAEPTAGVAASVREVP